MLSSNRFLKFDLKKPKCMQHLLSPAPSALSPCVANSSHQFLAASNYTEGFSCLVVSHPLLSAILFGFAKPQYTSGNRFLFSKMLLPRTGTLLNSSCQVLFSQLGAGQLLSRKHRHRQDHPPLSLLFLSSTQAEVSVETLSTRSQL